jgi:UDP-glucuronate decarboxylase
MNGLYSLMSSDYKEGPVNIGNDGEFTIQQLAEIVIELVSEMTGRSKVSISYHPKVADDPTLRRPQISLAKEVLHWVPVVHLREGLRETIEWHMSQGNHGGWNT